jgi:hypothetical protein
MQKLAILLALLLFLALTPIFPACDGLGELSEAGSKQRGFFASLS